MKRKKRGVRRRTHSLRRQLVLLISVSLGVLLTVQLLCMAWFTHLTKLRAFHYAQDNLSQISGQVTMLLEDVERLVFNVSFSNYMQEYLTTQDSGRKYVELYPVLSAMLDSMRASNNNIYDILLFDANGTLALSCQQAHSAQIYAQLQMPSDETELSAPRALPAVVYGNEIYYPFAQHVYGVSVRAGLMNRIGTCVTLCKGEAIQSLVGGIAIAADAELFVVNAYGDIIASNKTKNIGSAFDGERFKDVRADMQVRMDDGTECIVQHAGAGGWTVWSVVPVQSLLSDMHRAVQMSSLLSIAAVCLLLFTGVSISRQITQSVARITRFLAEVAAGHAEKRIHVDELDEITVIAHSANRMLDNLEESKRSTLKAQSALYEAQLYNRQAQFTALQRQINPHFLFNTLNCIASIAAVRDVPEVVQIASSMGQIFRYCIKGADVVALREEIACVHSYLEIIELRYRGKIRGVISVEDGILEEKMPKMILQPIVENAVFHGLEPKRGGGMIHIRGRRCGEGIAAFEIVDDGKGMDAQTLASLSENLRRAQRGERVENRDSIGLVNIAARIRFLLGERARIEVESQMDKGSRIVLYIPTMQTKEDGELDGKGAV